MEEVTIVIPAYNEGERIQKTLKLYVDFFSKYEKRTKILIVPNGCKDETPTISEEWAKLYPEIVESYTIKEAIGKGGAVKKGFELAKGKWVGFVDADGATSPEEYAKIIEAAYEADGAIAARWRKDSKVIGRDSLLRQLASKLFVIMTRIIFGFKYHDTQCGAKIFKTSAIEKILPHMNVFNMAFDVQLLYLLKRKDYNVIEIPTIWVDQGGSAMLGSPLKLFKQGLIMLKTLFKIKFQKI